MRKGWDTQADNWVRFARTPGLDKYHELMNLPAFLDLLPAPGRRTLDLGCGEGRVSRALAAAGHTMVATDSSSVLAAAAATLPPAPAVVVSDVARLPFTDGSFDLVVAYMCLHDIDGMADAIREAARVLQPGGRLAVAIPHPLNTAADVSGQDSGASMVHHVLPGRRPGRLDPRPRRPPGPLPQRAPPARGLRVGAGPRRPADRAAPRAKAHPRPDRPAPFSRPLAAPAPLPAPPGPPPSQLAPRGRPSQPQGGARQTQQAPPPACRATPPKCGPRHPQRQAKPRQEGPPFLSPSQC